MSREDRLLLLDVSDCIERITTWMGASTASDFAEGGMLYSAILRELTVIGEAVKQISASTLAIRPDVPWRQIAGLRDVVVHSYFAVSPDTIWDVAVTQLPPLRSAITELLQRTDG